LTTHRRTWHYGLIARWWAEFNNDGEDIGYFQHLIEENGQPAVDLGCGAGRLLSQFRASGLDVDGCDISEDMIEHCRERLARDGLQAELYVQAMDQLDLPRRYRTAVICGSFGIGGTRADDLSGLRRIHQHLEVGGLLAFDTYIPNVGSTAWQSWLPENRPHLPSEWPERGDRKTCADGTKLELKTRLLDFDPLDQTIRREIRVEHWQGDELIASEDGSIPINIYFKREIELMLQTTGFDEIRVKAGLTEEDARPWQDVHLMFVARRSG
jgi:SAM-dependent methyltransferase